MPARVDLTGHKYARLTVLEMVWGGRGGSSVRCRCDCGKEVTSLAYNVRNGNTRSCGCLSTEARIERGLIQAPIMGAANRTHGMTGTKTYVAWQEARKRCHSPTNQRYEYYGARGIVVCDRWRDSFENFLADMGECPIGLTLERLDNYKGYEPGNCVWATKEHQAQNKRTTIANPQMVRAIRARAAAGAGVQELATDYGMTDSNVYAIVSRQTWKNVE